LIQSRHVLVIGGPLERGPWGSRRLLGSKLLLAGLCILLGKRPQRFGGFDVPDHVVLAVVVECQSGMASFGDRDWPVRPGNQILFVGGERDQVDEGMREPPQPRPRRTSPELHALRMDRGEVCPQRRPLNESVGPLLSVDDVLWLILLVVPEHAHRLPSVHDKLIPAPPAGVGHEGPEVFLFLEWRDLGRGVLLIDAPLSPIPVDIGELVDAQRVPLVKREVIKLPYGGRGLGSRGEFDKGEAAATNVSMTARTTRVLGLHAKGHTSTTSRRRPWAYK
jgi:hypothetical protein